MSKDLEGGQRVAACAALASRDQRKATMTKNIPNILPPMSGSDPFIHNKDSAPAYWWLDTLWIVLADARDTGGRYPLMEELAAKG